MLFGIMLLLLPSLEHISAQVENPNIRVEDPSFSRESLQTGETITPAGSITAIIIEALGAILIILFIVIYAIKKRAKGVANDKN